MDSGIDEHNGRLTSFRYLTLDCYGTLIDWQAGIEASLASSFGRTKLTKTALLEAYVAEEKKEEMTYQRYREVLRKSALRLSSALGVEVDDSAASKFADTVPRWPAFPDTVKFLRDAGSSGYQRYILSNVDTEMLEGTIRNNGLEVDGYITAEEVGSYKPRRAPWVRFFEKTKAGKDEVLHVAQSVFHDIMPAQEMGIAAAWVNRYGQPMPRNVHPEFVSDDLANFALLL